MLGFYDYTTWLTYLGLASGIVGIGCAMEGNGVAAIICLCLAGFFDLFDGKVNSMDCIGKQSITMCGMISMLDNVNRILDRVAVYLA